MDRPTGTIITDIPLEGCVRVCDLINLNYTWNINKVKKVSQPFETDAISKTPLLGSDKQDARFWIYEKRGHYSVKTGNWRYKDLIAR